MRGTGKTKAMVEALPEAGSVVIVHTGAEADYVRRMVIDLRGRHVALATKVRTVASPADAVGALLGHRDPVFVDHAFQERASPSVKARVAELLPGISAGRLTVNQAREQAGLQPIEGRDMQQLRTEVSCLELRDGDVVVLRTATLLSLEQARAAKASLDRLTAERNLRNVGLLILDPGAELTVLRPSDHPEEIVLDAAPEATSLAA